MSKKIVCVTPTIRPESHASFIKAWTPLFEKHNVTLVTVWDGDELKITGENFGGHYCNPWVDNAAYRALRNHRDLFCRRTDSCRNLGFVVAAQLGATHVLTLDDDVTPLICVGQREDGTLYHGISLKNDPVQTHIDALDRRVPISWMNTAHDTDLYLRGVPYGVRDEAPVMLSHGVWVGVPDFDGETQLLLESTDRELASGQKIKGQVPYSLPYFVGPIPRGVLFPLSGMNVMVKREALPYFYFAPMGVDSGIVRTREVDQTAGGTHTIKEYPLNRFADIFMGVFLKREFDRLGWACVTGYSTVLHTRASDARRNFEQEKLGREWIERMWNIQTPENPLQLPQDLELKRYLLSYADKRRRYADLVNSILEKSS